MSIHPSFSPPYLFYRLSLLTLRLFIKPLCKIPKICPTVLLHSDMCRGCSTDLLNDQVKAAADAPDGPNGEDERALDRIAERGQDECRDDEGKPEDAFKGETHFSVPSGMFSRFPPLPNASVDEEKRNVLVPQMLKLVRMRSSIESGMSAKVDLNTRIDRHSEIT